jgi:hypothetical protein
VSQQSGGEEVSHDGRVYVREVRQDVPKGGALLREADEEGSVSAGTAAPQRNERQAHCDNLRRKVVRKSEAEETSQSARYGPMS